MITIPQYISINCLCGHKHGKTVVFTFYFGNEIYFIGCSKCSLVYAEVSFSRYASSRLLIKPYPDPIPYLEKIR